MATSPPKICDFTFDDSSKGRVPVDAAPDASVKSYETQTYTAKEGGTPISGSFVKFYPRGSFPFFIKLEDYKLRVGGNQSTYLADFTQYDDNGKLGCPLWDDDGKLVGQFGVETRAVPGTLVARKSRKTGDADRLKFQIQIWQSIAQEQSSIARSGRLWKSRDPINPPLELFIVANDQFLKKDVLADCIKDVKMDELNKWLKLTFLTKKDLDARKDLHCVSQHLLGMYASYMTEADLKRLIAAQTSGKQVEKGWMRALVTTAQAEEFHKAMIASGKYKGTFNGRTTTALTGARPKEERIDTFAIMGESANVWGNKFWPGDTAPGSAAEWLHRSAYSLGPMNGASWQSEANLVFGTYEANGNMTRAEASIDGITASLNTIFEDKAKGKLKTQLVNKGNYRVLGPKGLEEITIPGWVSDSKHSYSWLSPELQYWGKFTATHDKLAAPVNYPFETQFHTFNCYTPLTIEGQLDRRGWKTYFDKKYGALIAKKRKPDSDPKALLSLHARTIIKPTPDVATSAPVNSPSTTTPDYFKIPLHRDAWLAAHNQDTVFQMGNTEVRNPKLMQPPSRPRRSPAEGQPSDEEPEAPPSDAPPEGGFVLEGEIDLFGISELKATLKSWHGPPPEEIEVGEEVPICEQAEIDDVSIFAFLPWVAGTPLEKAHLSNVTFTYQNYDFVPMKPVGWSVSADLVVDDQFGSMNQILSQVLQISPGSLTLQVTASLGLNQSWSSLPSLTTFALQGLIFVKDTETDTYQSIRLCDGISLGHIGISVFGVSTTVLGSSGETTTSYGFSLFGQLDLEVPASKKPLEFDFEISEFGGGAEINALLNGDIWENALGLGFDLETVTFSASFDISSPLTTLDLSLGTVLDAQPTVVTLLGTYSVGGAFTLSADIQNFTCDSIVDLYVKFAGEEIVLPTDEELSIAAGSITMSSSDGLSVVVSDVKYGDYVTASAALHFGSDGVTLKADMEDINFPEFGVKLVDVAVNASFARYGTSKSSSVELDVVVELDGVQGLPKIQGTVHIYKEPEDQKLQWTVYGEFEALGGSTRLGTLFPEIDGTFMGDISLDDLAVIVASKDEPALSTMNPLKFPVKQGVQICAVLDTVEQVDQILRHPAPGLILSAAWSKASGFVLDIDFPTEGIIHLGSGVTTDPIELQINLKPVRLMIDAGLKIPVPRSPNPLDFRLALSIEDEEVYASGQMIGNWNNPFGISPRVSIGPNLALEIGIILPQFVVTGIPSAFGFVGGLSIGNVRGDVAVQINEDPTQELISGKLEHLGIQDVVEFTSDVISIDLPKPPNFIDFEEVSLYISTGVMIGTILYPAGFSFEADIKAFSSEFKVAAQITQGTLVAKGAIHNLTVGPLSVTGSKGGDATFDLQVAASIQHISVDGAINLLGSEVALVLNLTILPSPTYYFDLTLHLTPLLTFTVHAEMKGAADLHNLEKLEFILYGVMKQNILGYVVAQVNATLQTAKKTAGEGVAAAQHKVDEAQNALQRSIHDAQTALDDAYNRWKAHEQEVRGNFDSVINNYNTELTVRGGRLDQDRKDWDKAVHDAELKIREANADRAAKMQAAEANVTKAKNDWDDDIEEKEKELERAKEALDRAFANAEHDIDNAQTKVNGLQEDIDDLKNTIHSYEKAHWYEFWKKAAIPGLYTALGAVEASKVAADGVLDACKAVLQGTDYIAKNAAVTLAEGALETVKTTGDDVFVAAQETLKEVDKATGEILSAAEQALEDTRFAGDRAIYASQHAIDAFRQASTATLRAAQDAVDGLVSCAEWLAYQAATGALDAAKHGGSAELGIANTALEAAKKGGDGVLDILEDFFAALDSVFNIVGIEVTTDLSVLARDFSFAAVVNGIIIGEHFTLQLTLDLRDVSTFIKGIYL
ncbi:chromosome segregation atpases-like protein, partial [Moniliophthora roreri MCA 2997]